MIESNHIKKMIDGDLSDAKTRIIRAAIEEFALRSLEGARTRQITKKSGTNVAAISYHFGGKKALYASMAKEITEFFDCAAAPYYAKGKEIISAKDGARAKKMLSEFIFDTIKRFGGIREVSYLLLLMSREEAAPTEAFEYFYNSVYKKPVNFVAKLIQTAAKRDMDKETSLVYAINLWGNVRTYCARNGALMRILGWNNFGETQFDTLQAALKDVLDKTLKRK